MIKNVLVCLAAIGVCSVAQADEGSNWRLYAALGMSDGGDSIVAGTITNVQNSLVLPFDIKAGTATQLHVGADYRIIDRVAVQASVGYAQTAPMGYNGSQTFTTNPVELLGFVNITDGFRIGGGARKTFADLSGTGLAADWVGNGKYTSSHGEVVEAQYLFGASDSKSTWHNLFGISVRAVHESFAHDGISFSGNNYELDGAYYY